MCDKVKIMFSIPRELMEEIKESCAKEIYINEILDNIDSSIIDKSFWSWLR